MNKKIIAGLTVSSLALAGCGVLRNSKDDYRHAQEVPPLEVPAGLDDSNLGELYPVPAIPETNVLEAYSTAPRPQPLSLNSLEEVIKIQKLGDNRWILSNRSPSEIWPRIRNILNRSGIPTDKAEASEGVLETVWLEFKGDDAFNHRYRFYIQPGVQVNSTEIRVLHDQVSKELKSKSVWPGSSMDDGREKDMVDILANALAGDVTSGTVSLLAQNIGGENKVKIVTPRVADPYLQMNLDFDRSWASVAYSLARGGFTTIDQNQTDGVFYVHYTNETEEEKGWFGRMFSGGDKKIEVNYLVKVNRSEEGAQIRIVDKDGFGLVREEAIRLLKTIRANLS
jgi:outer membrane protein assembly factor BamC